LIVQFQHGKAFFWLEVALAAKPIFHRGLKAIERNAAASFEQAVGGGERVIKDCVVGEVAHGEVIDPMDWAQVMGAGGIDSLDGETARKHATTVTDADSPATDFLHTGAFPQVKPGLMTDSDRANPKQIARSVNETGWRASSKVRAFDVEGSWQRIDLWLRRRATGMQHWPGAILVVPRGFAQIFP
jgi:hypothetical protein